MFQNISKHDKSFLNVSVDQLGEPDSTPQQRIDAVAATYFKLWDPSPDTKLSTKIAFSKARQEALEGPQVEPFTTEQLILAAQKYRKRSKGSDHWIKEELIQLPKFCAAEIASALSNAYCKLVQPYQSLLNLNPLLGKPKGHRTICKTPMLYRFVCRHIHSIAQWEISSKSPA